jgi:hypothetical protein
MELVIPPSRPLVEKVLCDVDCECHPFRPFQHEWLKIPQHRKHAQLPDAAA